MTEKDEVWRRYWMGKPPKVKDAVMTYIDKDNKKTQDQIAEEYNITAATIIRHLKKLRDIGLLEDTRRINPCLKCKKNIWGVYPKYAFSLDHKTKGLTIVGYICEECYKEIVFDWS